ncbi:hypothetical protein AYK21_02250 [Thermoplasmatales archaeon SG8-52-2]|nr:MAG: hypothetical protein AYK21_02250 [Thermoplasmatales archaeon SG8-52-2]
MKEFENFSKTQESSKVNYHPIKLKAGNKIKSDIVKKGLVIGILLVFISISCIPTNANVVENNSNHIDNDFINSDYTNYLGKISFNLGRFSSEIGFEHPEITDYTFPVINGNYTLNFTVELNITSDQKLLLSRGVFTSAKISIGDSPIWKAFGINFIRGEHVSAWTIQDIERNYIAPPINGQETVTLSIILKARGFPFDFLKSQETSFIITAHFIEE